MVRRSHVLKANHHTRLPRHMVWVDTETSNEFGKQESGRHTLDFGVALYAKFTGIDPFVPTDSSSYRFDNVGDWWDWLTAYCIKGRSLWVMAHNWNYDAGILDTSNELLGRGWEQRKYINGKPPVIIRWWKDGASFVMIDTLNWFTTSVEELGQSVNLPKLPMPAFDATDTAWNAYAWRDVEIIKAAVLSLRRFIGEHDLGVMQPTLASQALTAFRHSFMHHEILIHDNEPALILERESYHGGRTEAFYRGFVEGPLFKLDINSMYPAIMQSTPVSIWFQAYFSSFKGIWWDEAMRNNDGIVAECQVATDEPVYGVVSGGKLIFPVGTFWTVLSTPEILYALERKHLLQVGQFATYKRAVIFDKFVDYFYRCRQNFKAQGNVAFNYMAKIFMNSLYGKMGQNGRKWVETDQYVWPDPKPGVTPMLDADGNECLDDHGKVKIVWLRYRLGRTQIFEFSAESENSSPIIAAEITATSRIWLWKLIRKAGEKNVYYVDTDSLVVNEEGKANLSALLDDRELGKLKVEMECTSGIFRAPKHYTLTDTMGDSQTKIKGIKKKAEALAYDITSREAVVFGQELFRSWDYNLTRGIDGFIDIQPITKRVSGENTKRLVSGDGWTLPIPASELGELPGLRRG